MFWSVYHNGLKMTYSVGISYLYISDMLESTQRATLWAKSQNVFQSGIKKTEKFCWKKGRVSQSSDRLAVDLMNIITSECVSCVFRALQF